jgi:hypothetical protein
MNTIQFHPVTDDSELGDLSDLTIDQISQTLYNYNNIAFRELIKCFPDCNIEHTPGNGLKSFSLILDNVEDEDYFSERVREILGYVFNDLSDKWSKID